MKTKTTFWLLAFVMISVTSFAQLKARVDPNTNKINYTNVVQVPGASEDVLMNRAKTWFITSFPEQQVHVDTTSNRLIGVGNWNRPGIGMIDGGSKINFKIIIEFKDEKYRYQVTELTQTYNLLDGNFTTTGAETTASIDPPFQFRKKVDLQVDNYILSLIENMRVSIMNSSSSNW